ncbi:FBD-associated F-box protein At5g38590-like [Hibiscus syriacus]|uniref:FBD-associated F-box protein At5g38590-like n=1 Tax=Hibiscus syriacus TaxID=106335 RepID=UPI001924958A|nr:FBD-associated F-box protein At5g38590-like [Hibiscus syriacus]
MAKQVKSVGELDRISSLPDPIICHIMYFLPTKDAVRTSILSHRWRLLFFPNQVSLECLNLHDPSPTSRDNDSLRLYGCLSAVLWRAVKEIVISSESENCPLFPTLLFTSQSLQTLKLNIDGEMKVPTNACLPNFKTLHLTNLVFLDGSILKLISSCHVLEDLSLDDM